MRRRLWPLLEAALKVKDEQMAEEILDEWKRGRISYEEAVRRLRTLTRVQE
jgi:hypothetical protein